MLLLEERAFASSLLFSCMAMAVQSLCSCWEEDVASQNAQ